MRDFNDVPDDNTANAGATQSGPINEAVFCANCGVKLKSGAKICHDCGAAAVPVIYLEELAITNDSNTPEAAPAVSPASDSGAQAQSLNPQTGKGGRKFRLPRWAIYVIIGVAVLLLTVLIFNLGRSSGEGDSALPDATPTPIAGTLQAAAEVATEAEEPSAADKNAGLDMPLLDVEGKDSDGMELPIPGEGETLYIGMLNYSDAELSKMAFILSANGEEIHDITIYLKNLSLDLSEIDPNISNLTVTESYQAPYSQDTFGMIDLGGSSIIGLTFDGNNAYGNLDYTYLYSPMNGSGKTAEFPFGTTSVEFSRIAGASRAATTGQPANMEPESTEAANSQIAVSFESSVYYVSIGEISFDENGNRTVEIVGEGLGEVLPFRNGGMIVPIQASMVSGSSEQLFDWTSASTSLGSIVFSFDTTDEPEFVYVYSYEDIQDFSLWSKYDVSLNSFVKDN